ncbi:hypothetical protein DV738_g3765, partial [Chaetothyriales sp. CBS 135597]
MSSSSEDTNGAGRDVEKLPGETTPSQPASILKRTPSKAESILSREVLPLSERRGLLGRLSVIPEVTNPFSYGNGTKWWMTVIVSFAAITSSTGSSIFYPALSEVAQALHTTPTVANLSLALYMLAMAFTPMWWSALSEKHGRRTIYLLSFALFLVFSCISAVSVNIAMLLVFRVLSGGAAASVQSVGAGTVADIWEPKERGKAMGIFYLGPLCGPGLAPVIGGALTQGLHWRSTLWFLTIFGGVMLLLILLCLPETVRRSAPAPASDNKNDETKENLALVVFQKVFGPLSVLGLLRYPPIIVAVWTGAISFFTMFVLNVSIQASFEKAPYNFSTILVGLVYLAPTIGYAFSSILGGRWIDYIMAREARKANRYDDNGKLKFLPEDRMKENIWIALSLYPAALIWYGWVVEKGVHWAVGCVACIFFGLGVMLVMGAINTVLTEFTPKKSSSGVALANFLRNLLSFTGAVITQPLIDSIGTGWMCTMVALIAFVTGNAAIFALRTWGPQWRVMMDHKLNAKRFITPTTSTAMSFTRWGSTQDNPLWATVDTYTMKHTHPPSRPNSSILESTITTCSTSSLPPYALSAAQAKFLALHLRSARVTHALEIGTLGGYTALWLATLNPDVHVTTIEANAHHAAVARHNIAQAGPGVSSRIDVREGAALHVLPQLRAEVHSGTRPRFGFVFIDADKANNWAYFSAAMEMILPGGVICVDNVVREGGLVDAGSEDAMVKGFKFITFGQLNCQGKNVDFAFTMTPNPAQSDAQGCNEKQGRHATFHSYPQYLFPSQHNNLASDLEVPYAFTHYTASFYWTKADALNDVRWNIWVQPPCLGCILKGQVKAKTCDRMRRQNDTFGTIRSCTECSKEGLDDACIETIELRLDGGEGIGPAIRKAHIDTPDRGPKNGLAAIRARNQRLKRQCRTFIDQVVWVNSERRLRMNGQVIWKPINLHVGDTRAKMEVVDSFLWSEGNELSRSAFAPNPGRFKRKVELGRKKFEWVDIRDTMKTRVAQWEGLDTSFRASLPTPRSDQPLLRLPHELVKRNFRNTQRYVEREREHILPGLKNTANAALGSKHSPEQTIAELDAMISRMQTFKRKLERLNTEEEAIHEHTSKRIRHLQDLLEVELFSDVKYEQWSRTRLDRLMVDYLLRAGYSKTAESLAKAKQIEHLIDLETFTNCHRIAASVAHGETKEALAWINENRNTLKKLVQAPMQTTDLEFELRLQQFIELVRANRTIEAREHASKYLSPHAESRQERFMHASGLLAMPADTTAEPYRALFSRSRWIYLSNLFVETHHTLLALPTQPLLHVALSAGLSALKTPACHSKYNPASSSTARSAKMATNSSLCPICSMELNDLARNVPYAHHTTSSVEADPVVLPNARIYGRARLEDLQRKLAMANGGADSIQIGKEGDVVDPTTGEKFSWQDVKKVYIM